MPTLNYILPKPYEFHYDDNDDTYTVTNTETGRVVKESIYPSGYKYFQVSGKKYYSHILVYQYANDDYDPKLDVDHIDTDRGNNRVDNLRLLTRRDNKRNSKKVRGYFWNTKRKKFQVFITINCKNTYVGQYCDECEARKAYKDASRKHHPGVNANFSSDDEESSTEIESGTDSGKDEVINE